MSKPAIAEKSPIKVELKKDKVYLWCSCGKSKNQPFCDASHKGTEFKPLKFSVEETQEKYLCRCKHTGNPPYCDGTHKTLK